VGLLKTASITQEPTKWY